MLWHAVFGCCTHHDHAFDAAAEETELESSPAPQSERPHRCCCHQHAATGELASSAHDEDHTTAGPHATTSHVPQPEAPCDGDQCSFMVVKIVAPTDFDFAANTSIRSTSQWIEAAEVRLSACRRPAATGDDRPPPLRAHLAISVLLI